MNQSIHVISAPACFRGILCNVARNLDRDGTTGAPYAETSTTRPSRCRLACAAFGCQLAAEVARCPADCAASRFFDTIHVNFRKRQPKFANVF